jgi:hypothetical protein
MVNRTNKTAQMVDASMDLSQKILQMLKTEGCDTDQSIYAVAGTLFQLHYERTKTLAATTKPHDFFDGLAANMAGCRELVKNLIERMEDIDAQVFYKYTLGEIRQ